MNRRKSNPILLFMLIACTISILGNRQIDPIECAQNRFETIESYSATIRSFNAEEIEIIQYAFKKPGYIRMDFVRPHKGAALVYNPETEMVTLRPFGLLKPFVLSLSPQNSLITSENGHTVNRSDIGSLLQNVDKLRSSGTVVVTGEEIIGNRECIVVTVTGSDGSTVDNLNRYDLWLDKKHYLPVKVQSYDLQGNQVENVLIDHLKMNVRFPDFFFQI